MTHLQDIDKAIEILKRAKREVKRQQSLSEKTSAAYGDNNVSQKRVQKLNADLNWQGMEVDKVFTDFARHYKKCSFKTGTEQKEYWPSSFHHYKY